MDFKIKTSNWVHNKYEAGQEIEVEQPIGGPWTRATIVTPVYSGCYEVLFPGGTRSIVHEFRIREVEAAG